METYTKNVDDNENIHVLKRFKCRQYLAAIIVTILSISNGFSAAWSSPVQRILEQRNNPLDTNPISPQLFSWITSVLYIGGLIGIFIWSKCADKFGRKMNGYLIASTQIVGWIGIVFATSPTHLIVSRFILGLGGCGIISNSQLYINETADMHIKGPLCALILVFNNVGIVLVNLFGFFFSYRTLNICCSCLPVLFVLLYFWLPETPLYLSMNNRPNEAKKSLDWFGLEKPRVSSSAKLERSSYQGGLFSSGKMRKITFVGMGLLVCQQFSGIAAILAYSQKIFQQAVSNSPISEGLSSIIVAIFQLVVSAISGIVIKSTRRKPLLVCSYVVAFFSYFLIFFNSYLHLDWYVLKFVPVFGVLCYVTVYNLGIGPLPLVIFPEMFPPHVLNRGVSLALVVLVIAAFIVLKLFPIIQHDLGDLSFLFLSCSNFTFALFVWQFLWETKPNVDKKLESVAVN